jgi:hypothetical protein
MDAPGSPFSGKLRAVNSNPHELALTPAPPSETTPDAAHGREVGGREVGGPEGPEPTRYGDWELRGRCIDF